MLTPTLSWNASSGATSYELQVSTNNTFTTLIIDQSGITGTSFTVPSGKLSNNTTYYWRVNSTNASGTSGWSSVWSLKTVIAPPVLSSPTNEATNISITPILKWSTTNGAASYRVQVSTSSTFSETVIDQNGITSTSYTVPSGKLSKNTKYYWRVNATNPEGTSEWSSVWNFTTVRR